MSTMSNATSSGLTLGADPRNNGSSIFSKEMFLFYRSRRGGCPVVGGVVIDAHAVNAVEGVQENNICLATTIINADLMQFPCYHVALYSHWIGIRSATKIDTPYVGSYRDMRPHRLDDGSGDGDMINLLIVIFFCLLLAKSVLDPPVIMWMTPRIGGCVKSSSYFCCGRGSWWFGGIICGSA